MKRFYEMTKSEIVDHLRSLYYAQPKADWDTLAVGNLIVSKGRAWRIPTSRPNVVSSWGRTCRASTTVVR